MIQRIQHLYLALIAVISIWFLTTVLIEFPSAPGAADTVEIRATGVTLYQNEGQTILSENKLLMFPLLLMFVNSFYMILLFKNRRRQTRLGYLNFFIIGGFMVCLFYILSQQISFSTFDFSQLGGNSNINGVLSFLMLILNFLALRGIAKDEELVRSADRIR